MPPKILIVLDQMGNHAVVSAAYYKRYDDELARFACLRQVAQLAECVSYQTVINAGDNALLATDDFLKQTIDWLAANKYADTAGA